MNTDFFSIVQLIWPALAVFELVVAIIAQNNHKVPATNLMIAGAVVSLISAGGYQLMNFSPFYDLFEVMQVSFNILSYVGSILFLIGLLNLINYLATAVATDEPI